MNIYLNNDVISDLSLTDSELGVYVALRNIYLSNRDYGSSELIQKLCLAGIERTLAQETVYRLCESGLINDERYAMMMARDMQERKLYPKRRIAMALREKGFSSEIISLAVDALPDEEEEQALALLQKKRIFGELSFAFPLGPPDISPCAAVHRNKQL